MFYDKNWTNMVTLMLGFPVLMILYIRYHRTNISNNFDNKQLYIYAETFFWGFSIGIPTCLYILERTSLLGYSVFITGEVVVYIAFILYIFNILEDQEGGL